jgi:hypothetical protein
VLCEDMAVYTGDDFPWCMYFQCVVMSHCGIVFGMLCIVLKFYVDSDGLLWEFLLVLC